MIPREELYVEGLPADVPSEPIVAFAVANAGSTVVDLGCGHGVYALRLRERGHDVRGVELDPAYAAEAERRGLDTVVADAAATPFADGEFETALLFEVLEHVPDPERVLREALRIARRNVLVTVPNVGEYAQLADYALTYWHLVTTDHVNFFTAQGLGELAERCGAQADVRRSEPLELFGLVRPRGPAWYALAVLRRAGVLRPVAFNRLYAIVRTRA